MATQGLITPFEPSIVRRVLTEPVAMVTMSDYRLSSFEFFDIFRVQLLTPNISIQKI
jgi:hypothetical protein